MLLLFCQSLSFDHDAIKTRFKTNPASQPELRRISAIAMRLGAMFSIYPVGCLRG
jgi:hypothetical protein